MASYLARWVLCLVNLFFLLLAGVGILAGIGKYMQSGAEPELHSGTTFLFGIPMRSICTGLFIASILLAATSLIELIAIVCESANLLGVYKHILTLFCVLTIAGIFASWFFSAQATSEARQYFGKLMVNATLDKPDMRAIVALNKFQNAAMCCGASKPSDWHNQTLLGSKTPFAGAHFPAICCGKTEGTTNSSLSSSSTCVEPELLYRDGCFAPVQMERYKFVFITASMATLAIIALLISMVSYLELDLHLADSQLINEQYASHLEKCFGKSHHEASRGTRRVKKVAAIRKYGSRHTGSYAFGGPYA